jgi:hypothetical protein
MLAIYPESVVENGLEKNIENLLENRVLFVRLKYKLYRGKPIRNLVSNLINFSTVKILKHLTFKKFLFRSQDNYFQEMRSLKNKTSFIQLLALK